VPRPLLPPASACSPLAAVSLGTMMPVRERLFTRPSTRRSPHAGRTFSRLSCETLRGSVPPSTGSHRAS
jgi:hypothetical protein